MDSTAFADKIQEFEETEIVGSPIWIWYNSVQGKEEAKCLICNRVLNYKQGSTSSLIKHLKRTHGPLSKYNAASVYVQLSEVKEKCQSHSKRKLDSASDSDSDFGKSHIFMTLKPHCFSTFCDPRFKHLYFSKRPEVADVNRRIISLVRAEMEMMEVERTNVSVVSSDADDSFWKGFQKDAQTD